jgi:hypothetical protein
VLIDALSDLHYYAKYVPWEKLDGDVLLLPGDIADNEHDVRFVNEKIAALPHRYKLYIPGNEDRLTALSIDGVRMLCDETIEIDGVRIAGMPSIIFRRPPTTRLGREADVIAMHEPPYDFAAEAMRRAIATLGAPLGFCGHFHDRHGRWRDPKTGFVCYNVTITGLGMMHPPTRIRVEPLPTGGIFFEELGF